MPHSSSIRHVRRTLCGIGTAILLAACRSAETTAPKSATPSAIKMQGGNLQTGVVGTALSTPLSVAITDADGKAVSGTRVDWDVAAGAGTTSPASSLTNSDGIATTQWTLGTVSGTMRVTAQVNGLNPVVFSATALAGPAAFVVASPDRAYLGVSDTLRVRASARDQYGNDLSGQSLTFTSLDATVAIVATNGLVTALAPGLARIVADAGGKSDTVPVTVSASSTSPCGPLAARMLGVGEVIVPDTYTDGARTCLTAPADGNGEYALTLLSAAPLFSTVTPIDVYARGNTGPTTAAISAGTPSGLLAPMAIDLAPVGATRLDVGGAASIDIPRQAELARRAVERRELAPLVSIARASDAARRAVIMDRVLPDNPSIGMAGTLAATLTNAKVGDAVTLNANPNQACSNADNRPGKVVAVGTRSIIVADNDNPSGGYTDAEYASVAATFDTLVYPMDTTAFGAPTNVSGSGKIILFYTKSVNALTPPSTSTYTIGGFFFARDLYPKTARNGLGACPTSNEAEMFYLLVPDPNGTINNNKRSKDEVTTLNLGTIAHEFQHLINSGRRLYVNSGAAANEETWLDEGLSHVAEELLYYRMSGFTSRQNLGLSQVASQSSLFSNYAAQNLSRFYSFLINPELNSPYAPNDSLATRGAIWNFLRFAAGRQGSAAAEATFLRAVVNSTSTGRTNLQTVLGGVSPFADYLGDWSVSLIADDYSAATTAGLNARFILPAWNFRSIYPGLRFNGGAALGVYPINARSLISGAPQRIGLAGGTSSYIRFGLQAGRSTLLSLSSNGTALPTTMRYALVRLK